MNIGGVEIEEPKPSDLKQTIVTAEENQRDYEATLKGLREQIEDLKSERAGARGWISSERRAEIEAEICRLGKEIATWTTGLEMVKKIKASSEITLKRIETLDAFDIKSAQLVEVSSKIGFHQVEMAKLFQDADGLSQELNQIAWDAVPVGSQFRARFGNGASDLLRPSSGANVESQINRLKEAADALGEFVKGRLASLRTLVEMALREQR